MRLLVRTTGMIVALILLLAFHAKAENGSCPPNDGSGRDATESSTVHGLIEFHDDTRGWLGLKLHQPICGQKEIELSFGEGNAWRKAKTLRGCQVIVDGKLSPSLTAYYSTDLNFFNPHITPAFDCSPQKVEIDPYRHAIPFSVPAYKATVWMDVEHQRPLRGKANNLNTGDALPGPWRAYANPDLNEEEDMDLSCHSGFQLASFSGSQGTSVLQMAPGIIRLNAVDSGPEWLSIVCRRSASNPAKPVR